jgi:hypothetical protein
LDDAAALLRAERDENICRLDLTPREKVALGLALEGLERPRAKARQRAGGQAGGRGSGKLPEATTGRTRDRVAAALGWSGRTYEAAKRVVKAAEEDEQLAPIVTEMDRTGNVSRAAQQVQNARVGADLLAARGAAAGGLAADFRRQLDTLGRVTGELTRHDPAAVAAALGADLPGQAGRHEHLAGVLLSQARAIRAVTSEPADEEKP